MNATHFLINTVFDLYLMVVILRIWLQMARADFYNPFSQFVVKATHIFVGPMRKVLPSIGNIDTASVVLALAVAALKFVVISSLFGAGNYNPVAILLVSLVVVIKQAFQLVFYILIIRAILSWVSQGYNPFESLLAQLTEPMLAPIRRIIPPIGGLDLSMLVLIIGLQFLQILMGDMFGRMF
ncbi:YggT family protein [Neptunicella marina]|uniref:YggT family protein n=1 Tax=Neptunicella marina TaxID=2125989 RepID=A0A8J6J1G1_9ALTE|nr:YggT family protein [Neptunicella marina]MBC3767818.1 YggT family protein [Neptunicella marina]